MKSKVEQDNQKQLDVLCSIDKNTIKKINMISIGLLDSFGKLIVEVETDGLRQDFMFISPVPVESIIHYLEETNLIDITTLRKF